MAVEIANQTWPSTFQTTGLGIDHPACTVLAHGCFDLLHIGHIKHLQAARRLGDRLVVSITADEYVGKGIGRPHFNEHQRAEAIRALACVDDVIISRSGDATGVIRQIHPDVYVKGVDYQHDTGDGLARERTAVEAIGGKLVFTETEKFSSSRLINSEKFSLDVVHYLETAKIAGFKDKIFEAFDRADRLKIAFVGEAIIDEYRYVQGLGRASKELMLATVETGHEEFEGGAIAASRHAEWAGAEWIATGQNIRKTRFVDADFNRKLFDVYSAKRIELPAEQRESFRKTLRHIADDFDCVVVMDFGHGLIEKAEREILMDADFLAVNAQTNAGNYGYNLITKYDVADFVCIDDPEARLAAKMPDEPIDEVMRNLAQSLACSRFLVTHGRFGSAYRQSKAFGTAPAFAFGGIDTMGAGDAVMAATAPLVAAGLPVQMAALVGNVAGAIKTSIVGHRRHVGRQEIVTTIEALLA